MIRDSDMRGPCSVCGEDVITTLNGVRLDPESTGAWYFIAPGIVGANVGAAPLAVPTYDLHEHQPEDR